MSSELEVAFLELIVRSRHIRFNLLFALVSLLHILLSRIQDRVAHIAVFAGLHQIVAEKVFMVPRPRRVVLHRIHSLESPGQYDILGRIVSHHYLVVRELMVLAGELAKHATGVRILVVFVARHTRSRNCVLIVVTCSALGVFPRRRCTVSNT